MKCSSSAETVPGEYGVEPVFEHLGRRLVANRLYLSADSGAQTRFEITRRWLVGLQLNLWQV